MAKNFAKKKKGSIAIWQIFEIILFAALVYTFITLWPVFLQKQNVDYIAKTMVRAVETNGRIDSSITDLQHELENDFGVELDDEGGQLNMFREQTKFKLNLNLN